MVAEQQYINLLLNLDRKLDAHRHELLEKIDSNRDKQDQSIERLSEKIDDLKAEIRKEVKEVQSKVDSHDHTLGWIKKVGATGCVALITSLVTHATGWWRHVIK